MRKRWLGDAPHHLDPGEEAQRVLASFPPDRAGGALGAALVHPVASEVDVGNAIRKAEQACQVMRRLPRSVRVDILVLTADLVHVRLNEFVETISAEAAKPLDDARGEVSPGIINLRNSAAEAR